jgi:hypothetical protein
MTRADPRFESLAPLTCASCGARVLVAKFSPQHTSVQWDAAAVGMCLEFDGPSPLVPGCGRLRFSIDDAVADGRLTVAPP